MLKIKLSPARQAQNTIFDFSKKSTFSEHQKSKIVLSPTPEAYFYDVAPAQK